MLPESPTNVEDVDKFVCKSLADNVMAVTKVHKMAAGRRESGEAGKRGSGEAIAI
jgi:hypothetical protein